MEKNSFSAPSPLEVQILAVLWARPGEALKLGQIHQALSARRPEGNLATPVTTISSTLRNAVARGLLIEVRLTGDKQVELPAVALRGSMPVGRSPQTAYKAACKPSDVLPGLLRELVDAYPPEQRLQALLDVAEILQLTPEIIHKIKKLGSRSSGAP